MKNAALKKPTTAKKPKLKVSSKKEIPCAHTGCKKEPSAQGYCRLHYITNWKHIRFKEKVKAERRLNAYVDRIAKKYPKDYLDKIKETLEDETKFKEMVSELEIELDMSPKETDDEFLAKFLRAVKPGSSSE
jgi:hypothetical protein